MGIGPLLVGTQGALVALQPPQRNARDASVGSGQPLLWCVWQCRTTLTLLAMFTAGVVGASTIWVSSGQSRTLILQWVCLRIFGGSWKVPRPPWLRHLLVASAVDFSRLDGTCISAPAFKAGRVVLCALWCSSQPATE